MKRLSESMKQLENQGLLRELKLHSGDYLNFSSNDYLNLSSHPLVKKRAIEAVEQFGTGAGGSRLMAGNLSIHGELEKKLAKITGMETALVFGSGFLTNMGVLTALSGRGDVIFSDKLNHASLIDGASASRAAVKRYRHCSVDHLSDLIHSDNSSGQKFIVTDSLFSMNGDIAPLMKLHKLARSEGCILVVDEAHAIGVFGKGGGICKSLGIVPDIITGTLSKALGSYGGFAACSSATREYLVNRSRSFVYTTGLPPAATAAALGALEILDSTPEMGRALLGKAALFRKQLNELGFDTCNSNSQIVPVKVGENLKAVALSGSLERAGILAVAIRPPTVPDATARLRFSLTLSHSTEDIMWVLSLLKAC